MSDLPKVSIILPRGDNVMGKDVKLIDPITGKEDFFDNTTDIEIMNTDGEYIKIGFNDPITEDIKKRLLVNNEFKSSPIIAKIKHDYDIKSIVIK